MIPKGFFPQQDTGIIVGLSDAPQDISFDEMVRRQHALMDVVARDPDVASYGTGTRRQPADQQWLRGHRAQAARSAQRQRRSDHHPPAAAAREGAGRDAVPAGGAGSQRRRPHRRARSTNTRCRIRTSTSSTTGRRSCSRQLQKLPMLRDVASDQQTSSGMLSLTIDRDQAARFGIQPAVIDQTLYDAFGQRQVAQFFTQAQQLPRDPGDHALAAGRSRIARQALPEIAAHRPDGAALGDDQVRHAARDLPVDQSSGAVSGGHAVVQSRAGRGARRRGRCDQPGVGRHAPAGDDHRHLPGHGAGLPELAEEPAVSDSRGAGGGLHHSRHALRELHSSADHSLDAAVGRRRRAAGAADVSHRSVGDRADRHHSADRHRQEERHHDGRLRHPGRARAASVAARCDPPGLPAALSADHDDHHGGAARRAAAGARPRHRLGAAPAAGLHHGRRPDPEPGVDAVHDAGDLSVSGSVQPVAEAPPPRDAASAARRIEPRPRRRRSREAP